MKSENFTTFGYGHCKNCFLNIAFRGQKKFRTVTFDDCKILLNFQFINYFLGIENRKLSCLKRLIKKHFNFAIHKVQY